MAGQTHFKARRDKILKELHQKPLVMGILNVTPDSFSDGGLFIDPLKAVQHAKAMRDEGADLIDIGSESTRPGSTPVDAHTEWARLAPVLGQIHEMLPDAPISIDTYKAETAAKALDTGAVIVNDVSGLQHDPAMADLVAEREAGVIIMHKREAVDESLDIMADIESYFMKSLEIALNAGIPDHHIILDPGIGFQKSYAQNFTILNQLSRLKAFGLPLLIALSRKRFIGRLLDIDSDHRLVGTLTANLYALGQGARMVRVHDVAEHVQAVKMFTALEQGQP